MNENLNYISDQELEQLILQVDQEELVAAPPDLMESILEAVEVSMEGDEPDAWEAEDNVSRVKPVKVAVNWKKEFYAYCFRVITSVAAAVALIFMLPEISGMDWEAVPLPDIARQEVPSPEEVVDTVPSRDEVVLTMQTPTKDEVLNDTGFLERVLSNTGWFDKKNGN